MLVTFTYIGRDIAPAVYSYRKREKSVYVPTNPTSAQTLISKPRHVSVHRFQEAVHFGQEPERIV